MRPALRYHASMAVTGSVLGLTGLSTLVSGNVTIPAAGLSIGGIGMVLSAIYERYVSDDPAVPDGRVIHLMTLGAVLALLGGVISLVT
ncbi:hypothetical protein ACT4ML_06090 [Natrinema sp. LN54]|uniref:hypothetical protein n=1 Tax=Natrinema sp. LN54 TaxID=3458705 RepID=UPI004035BAFF